MKKAFLTFVMLTAAATWTLPVQAANSDCSTAHQILGEAVAVRQDGDLNRARQQMRSLRDACPQFVNARLELAVTLSWIGDLDEAVDEYADALELEPANRAALLGKARVLSWRGDTSDAREIYGAILLTEPGNAAALNGLALANRVDGRFGAARRLYRKVIGLDPGNREAVEGLHALRRASQLEGTMILGQVALQDGRHSVGNFAGLTWRPTGRVTYSGSLRTSASVGETPSRTTATAGMDRRISRRLTIGLAYEQQMSTQRHRGALVISSSWRISPATSVFGSLKPAAGNGGERDILTSVGAVQSIGRAGHVVAQIFHFRSSTGYRSTAGAASAQIRLSDRIQARPMVTASQGSFRTVIDVGLGATARLTHRLEAGLQVGAGSAGQGLSRFGVSLSYRR